MNKQKLFSTLFIVLIIVVISAIILMYFWIQSESAMCLKDPMGYVAKVSENTCYCVNYNF